MQTPIVATQILTDEDTCITYQAKFAILQNEHDRHAKKTP